MDHYFDSSSKLREFFEANKNDFESTLLDEAVNVRNKINEILKIGNINLVNNAHQLTVYIINSEDNELKRFAKKEGIAWATHSLELSFKLEWVQAIRRALWIFIHKYYDLSNQYTSNDFFTLEAQINTRVDLFLNEFFISYSTYKDSLIHAQKELVENLSVPIIPINGHISILPLIGSIDMNRIHILKEKVLAEVSNLRIETLIMDLSGLANMEQVVISEFLTVIDGISLMGCSTVLTGLRKEVALDITRLGITFNSETKVLGTLQQALGEYL